jgi:hypothetical protein
VATRASGLLHEAGFQADGYAIHLAGDLVIALHQADGFGLRSAFEHLRPAAQLQILDQDDTIAVREHIAVGVPPKNARRFTATLKSVICFA